MTPTSRDVKISDIELEAPLCVEDTGTAKESPCPSNLPAKDCVEEDEFAESGEPESLNRVLPDMRVAIKEGSA